MRKVTYWGSNRCNSCRKALKWLQDKKNEVAVNDIVLSPPSVAELRRLIAMSGLDIGKFYNVTGDLYREMKLKDRLPGMSPDEKIELLAAHGKLLKRPLVTDGAQVTVGFKEELFAQRWD